MSEHRFVNDSGTILVVGALGELGAASAGVLAAAGYRLEAAADPGQALARVEVQAPDVVLVNPEWSGCEGFDLIERLQLLDADIALVVLTPPIDPTTLSLRVARALEHRRLVRGLRNLRARFPERHPFPEIVGDSPVIQEVLETLVQISGTRRNVLLTGEAGTGKSLVAAALHRRSPGGRRELLTIPCGSLTERMLSLRLEHAQGATVFLEEVDQSPPPLQASLLHCQGELDLRLLAATSRDLRAEVRSGRFRDDLYQRLAEVDLRLPALRERSSDVPALAMHFLARHAARSRGGPAGFDQDALGRLCAHRWPGNVRELDRVVERAAVQARGPRITVAELPEELQALPGPAGVRVPGSTLAALERYAILETLKATSGSTSKAARMLGISVRNVQYKVRAYGPASDLRGQDTASEKVA